MSNQNSLVRLSKFLSLVLRHQPQKVGLQLDAQGWAEVEELLQKARAKGVPLDMESLQEVVEQNDKQRFAFNADKSKVRANQGHSLAVDLQLEPQVPPATLYHGTAERNLESILQEGLHKRKRQHVHLSTDIPTAQKVGARWGKPVVLQVEAGNMQQAEYTFFRSENGVWLTEHVPAHFLLLPK